MPSTQADFQTALDTMKDLFTLAGARAYRLLKTHVPCYGDPPVGSPVAAEDDEVLPTPDYFHLLPLVRVPLALTLQGGDWAASTQLRSSDFKSDLALPFHPNISFDVDMLDKKVEAEVIHEIIQLEVLLRGGSPFYPHHSASLTWTGYAWLMGGHRVDFDRLAENWPSREVLFEAAFFEYQKAAAKQRGEGDKLLSVNGSATPADLSTWQDPWL
jgi:hypothetical protein